MQVDVRLIRRSKRRALTNLYPRHFGYCKNFLFMARRFLTPNERTAPPGPSESTIPLQAINHPRNVGTAVLEGSNPAWRAIATDAVPG
jgi:hypothetical protein